MPLVLNETFVLVFSVRRCLMDPPLLQNGRVVLGPNVVGSVVNYTCDTGYQFSNNNTQRTCMIDQTWSSEDISCEKGKIAIALFCTSTGIGMKEAKGAWSP